MHNLKTYLKSILPLRRKEEGATLVEVMVYVLLLVVVLAGIVTIVVSSTSASSRFTTTTATQADVNRTQAVLFRDLALTQQILQAGGDHIQYNVIQDNKQFRVTVFSYEGETRKDKLPDYVQELLNTHGLTNKLPEEAAIMSIREQVGSSFVSMDALTKGYDPEAYKAKDMWLFTYFDENNEKLALNSDKQFEDPEADRNKISRISFRIAADAPGRASKVQAESSVTPPLNKTNVSNNLTNGGPGTGTFNPPKCPVQFSAHIPTGERAAVINWSQVQGATQYYITRYEFRNNAWTEQTQYTVDNPSVTEFKEPANSLVWGGKYRYSISVENVAGRVDNCTVTNPVSVIPQKFDFQNINPHAYSGTVADENLIADDLTGLKKDNSSNRLASSMTVNGVTRAANTVNPLQNARYTVARNLTNQVAWQGTFGADSYEVYRNGNRIAVVTPQTQNNDDREATAKYSYQDTNRNYGEANIYSVIARNDGGGNGLSGESKPSDPVTLYSPPADVSTYTVTANDPTTKKSSNTITLKSIAPNTVGFRGKYNTAINQATCTALPKVDADNKPDGTAGYRRAASIDMVSKVNAKPNDFLDLSHGGAHISSTQPDIEWGSTTCYRLIPYNDAGSYQYAEGSTNLTDVVKADQKPERFTIKNTKTTNKFYNLDYSEDARMNNTFYRGDNPNERAGCLLYTGPNKNQWGTDELFCNGSPNYSWGVRSPIGAVVPKQNEQQMFINSPTRQIYGNQQAMTVTWNTSNGAYGGYDVIRTNTNKGNGAITNYANTKTMAVPYIYGNKLSGGFQLSGEWPGANFSFQVKSKAANGLVRDGGTDTFASSPAPSKNVKSGVYLDCAAGTYNQPAQDFTGPSHGNISSYSFAYTGAGRTVNSTIPITNGGTSRVWGPTMKTGQIDIRRTGHWNGTVEGNLNSITTRGGGNIVNLYCDGDGWWPQTYPTYWGGMSMRYGGAATLMAGTSSDTYWPNYNKTFASDEAVPDPIPPAEEAPKDFTAQCDAYVENSPEFIQNKCQTGTGIAAPPVNLKVDKVGHDYKVSWDAVPGANKYTIYFTLLGETKKYEVTSGTSYTLKNVTDGGLTYLVNVQATNAKGAGLNSEDFRFTTVADTETYTWEVTVTRSASAPINYITWNLAANNIVSHKVELMRDGRGTTVFATYNPSSPSLNLSDQTIDALGTGETFFKVVVTQTGSDGKTYTMIDYLETGI